MKGWVLAGLLLVIGASALGQSCQPELDHVMGLKQERQTYTFALAMPLRELWEKLKKVTVGGSATLSFTTTRIQSGWQVSCPYPGCCPPYIDVSVFAAAYWPGPLADPYNPWLQLQHTAFLVPERETRKTWLDLSPPPSRCWAKHEVSGSTVSSSLTLGVRVGRGLLSVGYAWSQFEMEVWSSPVASCGTGDEQRCLANEPPTLAGPRYFHLAKGETTALVLIVTDNNGADDIVNISITKVPKGVQVMPGKRERVSPYAKAATFYLSTDVVFRPDEAYLEALAEDRCRKKAVLRIPIGSQRVPPRLALEQVVLRDGECDLWFTVTDRDCGERFLVEVHSVVGGEAILPIPDLPLKCWGCDPCTTHFVVVFRPSSESAVGSFVVKVTDSYGFSVSLRWSSKEG